MKKKQLKLKLKAMQSQLDYLLEGMHKVRNGGNSLILRGEIQDARDLIAKALPGIQEQFADLGKKTSDAFIEEQRNILTVRRDVNATMRQVGELIQRTDNQTLWCDKMVERIDLFEARLDQLSEVTDVLEADSPEAPAFTDDTALMDMLGLVDIDVDQQTIGGWAYLDRAKAFDWAIQQHLIASDNEFDEDDILELPKVLEFKLRIPQKNQREIDSGVGPGDGHDWAGKLIKPMPIKGYNDKETTDG